jgi:nucleotide-binding universal stress UspA family protein
MSRPPTFRFQTIVVAVDLSEACSSALRYAQAVAKLHAAKIVITHVIDPVSYAFPAGLPQMIASDQAAREEVSRMEEETRRQGIAVHSKVETGAICDQIVQAVREHHADLLILGTRAQTGAGRAALGTIARQLLVKARCPVLTIAPEADRHLPRAGCWREVLVATDFSHASLEALDYAHRVTYDRLTVLHAEPCEEKQEQGSCIERLRFLAPFNEAHTVPVEHIVAMGNAGEIIADHANRMHADVVVLGSPANELKEEDFASSTVLYVVSHVHCPVLCVPSTLSVPVATVVKEVAQLC